MQFTTLNKVIKTIETICANHAQVAQVQFGEESDISTEQQRYPLVWLNVQTSNINEKTLYLSMSISVMDIQKADMVNERDTLSDCLSIAQDIYAALFNSTYQDEFLIQENASLTPTREAMPDLVNGWRMEVTFELAQEKNRCQIPN